MVLVVLVQPNNACGVVDLEKRIILPSHDLGTEAAGCELNEPTLRENRFRAHTPAANRSKNTKNPLAIASRLSIRADAICKQEFTQKRPLIV
jgi:hypothetical protein